MARRQVAAGQGGCGLGRTWACLQSADGLASFWLQAIATAVMAYLTAAGLNFGRYAVVTAVI